MNKIDNLKNLLDDTNMYIFEYSAYCTIDKNSVDLTNNTDIMNFLNSNNVVFKAINCSIDSELPNVKFQSNNPITFKDFYMYLKDYLNYDETVIIDLLDKDSITFL